MNTHNPELRLIEILFSVFTHGALTDVLVIVPPVQNANIFIRTNRVLITLLFPKVMLSLPSKLFMRIGDGLRGRRHGSFIEI